MSCFGVALFVPALLLVPYMGYGVNCAEGFREDFAQVEAIGFIYALVAWLVTPLG